MPRRCSICDHPDRDAIEAALVGNDSLRGIARTFALSEDALTRHKNAHLPPHLAQAHKAQEASHADDLLKKMADIEREAKRIAKKAEDAGDLRTAMSGIRELARLVELLAKLRGELNEGQTVNVFLLPEWQQLRARIITALAAHPQARLAVVRALEGSDSVNSHVA